LTTEEFIQDNDEPGKPPSDTKPLSAPQPPLPPASQAALLSDEDVPPDAHANHAPRNRKPKMPPLGSQAQASPASDMAQAEIRSKVAVAQQTALPSNEDAPPQEGQRKSSRKEVLIIEEVHNQKANRELRGKYADKAYELASGCIQFWAVAISANGIIFGLTGKLMISDTAMIAITTGVTVNVLACFLGVIRGLFPSDHPKKKPRKNKSK